MLWERPWKRQKDQKKKKKKKKSNLVGELGFCAVIYPLLCVWGGSGLKSKYKKSCKIVTKFHTLIDPYLIFVQEWVAKHVFAFLVKATKSMAEFDQLRLTNGVNTFSGASFASLSWNGMDRIHFSFFFAKHNLKIKISGCLTSGCFFQTMSKRLVNKDIQMTNEHMKKYRIKQWDGHYTPLHTQNG